MVSTVKGSLISDFFFTLAQTSKKGTKSRPSASSLWVDSAQGRDLAPSFGDLSQSKTL